VHLFTVGHSTRTLQKLISLLKEHGVQVLVDVRRWPSSKRNPQYNRGELQRSLETEGIEYVWLGEELGGYRREGLGEESPNKAWRGVQKLRRPHPYQRVPERSRKTPELRGKADGCHHVLRKVLLALPPQNNLRLPKSQRAQSHPHHREGRSKRTQTHRLRQDRKRKTNLPPRTLKHQGKNPELNMDTPSFTAPTLPPARVGLKDNRKRTVSPPPNLPRGAVIPRCELAYFFLLLYLLN